MTARRRRSGRCGCGSAAPTILRGVDLTVGAGEWVTVIGPNGAGKSTLLRAVGGLLPGRRRGRAVRHADRPARPPRCGPALVATVAQSPVVPPGMAVLDYVLLGRTPYIPPLGRESAADLAAVDGRAGPARPRRRSRAASWTRCPAASGSGCSWPGRWPRAPPLLLLDEPTTALDIGHQQEVLELVDQLRRDRRADRARHHARPVDRRRVRRPDGAAGRRRGGRRRAAPRGADRGAAGAALRARVRVIDGEHGPLVVPVRG